MTNWVDDLTPEERASWDSYVDHIRRKTLQGMTDSAMVMSVLTDEQFDVQFATELGMAVLLDKPIVVIRHAGARMSATLEKIAYAVIEGDIDTPAGTAHVARVIKRVTEELDND